MDDETLIPNPRGGKRPRNHVEERLMDLLDLFPWWKRKAHKLRLRVHGIRHHWRNEHMITASTIVGKTGTLSVTPVPSNGVIDPGTVKYTADTPSSVTITPAADGMSAQVLFTTAGTVTLSVAATSLGTAIVGDDTVQVTVASPPVPATALHVAFGIP